VKRASFICVMEEERREFCHRRVEMFIIMKGLKQRYSLEFDARKKKVRKAFRGRFCGKALKCGRGGAGGQEGGKGSSEKERPYGNGGGSSML